MRRQAGIPEEWFEERGGLSIDRMFLATVTESYHQQGIIDVRLQVDNQPVLAVRVLRFERTNDKAILEDLPQVGDLGLVAFVNGNRREPVWVGWFERDDDGIRRGVKGQRRRLLHGVETLIEQDGSVTIRTAVDPVSKQPDAKRSTTIAIAPSGGVTIDTPQGQPIVVGKGSEEVLVKRSYIEALEAKVAAMDTVLGALQVAAFGTAYKAAIALSPGYSGYEAAKADGLTRKLKGG